MSPTMRDGIVKRGSRWAFKLELPPDPATGKRRQKWVSGFRTRKEAQAARDDARARLRAGTYLAPSRETVGEYLTGWLAGVRGEYAPCAHDAAKLHVERYIIPRIGATRLAELTTPMVKAFYADLAESGRIRGDRPLSAKTVHNVHRTLSRALNDAVAELPPRILMNRRPGRTRLHRHPSSRRGLSSSSAPSTCTSRTIVCSRCGGWRPPPGCGAVNWRVCGGSTSTWTLAGWRCPASVRRARAPLPNGGSRASAAGPCRSTQSRLRRCVRTGRLSSRSGCGGDRRGSTPAACSPTQTGPRAPGLDHQAAQAARLRRRAAVDQAARPQAHARHADARGWHPHQVVQERLGHSSIAITGDVYSDVSQGLQDDAAARVAAVVDGES